MFGLNIASDLFQTFIIIACVSIQKWIVWIFLGGGFWFMFLDGLRMHIIFNFILKFCKNESWIKKVFIFKLKLEINKKMCDESTDFHAGMVDEKS